MASDTVNSLQQLLDHDKGLALCWLGNAGWLIYGDGHLIAFDLELESDLRLQTSPIATEALGPFLDILFITHTHGDHFEEKTVKTLIQTSSCEFVLPANALELARQWQIPQERIHVAHPGKPFELDGIEVEPQRAMHGNEQFCLATCANFEDCGYIFNLGGKRFLQPGDTVLLQEYLYLEGIEVLFVSPTIHNTHVDRSAIMINALEPNYIFPQHFDTYPVTEEDIRFTKGYVDELKKTLSRQMQQRYHKLKQGEIFVIKD